MSSENKKRSNEFENTDDSCKSKKLNHDVVNHSINDKYSSDFITQLSKAFSDHQDIAFENGATVIGQPFCCCVLPDFLQSDDFVKNLHQDCTRLDLKSKDNDLFKFKQSDELLSCQSPCIASFRKILIDNCLPLIKNITNIPLNEKVDMSCSVYGYTDRLLCHDDELEGRRVAYIFYLVPDWIVNDGGSLDLFSSESGQPTTVATSIYPKWNSFTFFEVNPISFHQVSEILANKKRVSISGWFHGPPLERTNRKLDARMLYIPSATEADIITEWINPLYTKRRVQSDIRKKFERLSEILLPNFLKDEKYKEISQSLTECQFEWKGPANVRKCEELEKFPPIIKKFLNLLHSEAMCLFLSNLTTLNICHVKKNRNDKDAILTDDTNEYATKKITNINECKKEATCLQSVHKWSHGCYTLLHDDSLLEDVLDATLYFNCDDWNSEYGGYTSYIDKEDSDVLLQVEPKSNCFSLVYCVEDTSKFIKYIDCRANTLNTPFFYDISAIYFEDKETVENL